MSKARRKCGWCGRGPNQCAEHGCISDPTKLLLLSWIRKEGTSWRESLRKNWKDGGNALHALQRTVGPRGLSGINPTQAQVTELMERYQ
jgi:hypothetical protein